MGESMLRFDDAPKRPTGLSLNSKVLDTAALGAVPNAELRKRVASLREHRLDIRNALDALFGAC